MTEAAYKRILLVGALWNLVGGTFIVVATGWIFSLSNLPVPSPSEYYYSWIALFMTFGLGYYLAYRDMYRNRDIVLLGAIGKLAFAAIFLYGYATHAALPLFFLIPTVGDILFAVLYLMFVRFAAQKGNS